MLTVEREDMADCHLDRLPISRRNGSPGFIWLANGAWLKNLSRTGIGLLCAISMSAFGQTSSESEPWTLTLDEPVSVEIPKAMERPLSVEDGPQITVERFELDVDPQLAAVLPADLRASMDALLEQRRVAEPSFTIGKLEQIAGELTDLLRDNNLIVSYAYLPTQEVENGQVVIGVLGGTLGDIHVEGNRSLSADRIASPFGRLVGKPLQGNELESAILNLRDYPGVAPSAVLSPGTEVGTTDLTLRVLERRFNLQAMADNYGSEATGEGRARIRFDWNNPLKRGDRLTVNFLQTFSPADGTYGGVNYEIPVGNRGLSFGALYDLNTFDATGGGIKTGGDSETIAVYARQKLKRSRELNLDLTLDFLSKTASFDPLFTLEQEDALSVLALGLDLEAVDRIGMLGVNSLQLAYSHGFPDVLGSMGKDGVGDSGKISTRVGSDGFRAGGEFDKVIGRYQRLQQLNSSNAIVLRAFGQWSNDMLSPLEQLSLGGAYTVRAYPTAQELVDKGAFGSAEYTLNATSLMNIPSRNWDLNFSLFYDYAYGKLVNALQSERSTVKLGGYGAGVHFEYRWPGGQGVLLRLEVASPTTNLDTDNGRDPQYWLRFEYFRR